MSSFFFMVLLDFCSVGWDECLEIREGRRAEEEESGKGRYIGQNKRG